MGEVQVLQPQRRGAQQQFYSQVAQRIAALREQHRLTQQQLAEKVGMPRTTVRAAEGDSICSLYLAYRLGQVFGCSIDQLCGGEQGNGEDPGALRSLGMHLLIKAACQLPPEGVELLASTALELQQLFGKRAHDAAQQQGTTAPVRALSYISL